MKHKLSARKLELSAITSAQASEFFKLNHIQGAVKGATNAYGLFHEGVLVAAASFGKARFKHKASHEWLRYAVAQGVIIYRKTGPVTASELEKVLK